MFDLSNLTDGINDLATQGQDAADQATTAAQDATQSVGDVASQAQENLPVDQITEITEQASGVIDTISNLFGQGK